MFNFKHLLTALAISTLIFGCKKDDPEPQQQPTRSAPTTYNFDNASYEGQIIRILLLTDLEAKLRTATTSTVTAAELNTLFTSNNEVLGVYTDLGTGKNLEGAFLKSSAINATTRQIWMDTINVWFQQVETLSGSGTLVRADGVDLSQAIPKVLMGGIFYDQAVNKYLGMVPSDNNTIESGKTYSPMEHHFDEAFGYFGAARNYNEFTDAELTSGTTISNINTASAGWKDFNGNGTFDIRSEYNSRYFSATAAKRDKGSASFATGSTDYTNALFTNFIKGRYAIVQQDYIARDAAIAQIRENWEAIIAATAVHYINDTKSDLASNSADLGKHWSEMKYYFVMLSFYPQNKLQADLNTIIQLMGNNPGQTDAAKLDQAAQIIKTKYNFTDEQISGWRLGL